MARIKSNITQKEKFIETARQLECDESEENFDKQLKQIAQVKPDEIQEEKTD